MSGNSAGAGGIANGGLSLALTGSTVSGNDNSEVGGILNGSGSVTLTNSAVSGNSDTGVGGIENQGGKVVLMKSTVRGNSTTATSFDAIGGILNWAAGVLTLTSSTISGNSASGGGSLSDAIGGAVNRGSGSVLTLTNSTVSGNSASVSTTASGSVTGAINNEGGSVTLTSSTLSGNSVSEPTGSLLPPVAGIGNFLFGGTLGPLTIENGLIAGQSGGPNCYGLAFSSDAGYNLDDGTSCGFSSANHSLSNTDPRLDPGGLQNNGGPTQTIALQPGSPAIDAIPPAVNGCGTTITTDQRGVNRPQGSGCDIGAFELVQPGADLAITKSGAPNPVVSGNRLTYTLTITNNGPQDATDVTVTDQLSNSLHFNSVTSTQGTCSRSTTAPKDGTITCSLGNLANGAKASIMIVVTTTTPGALTNTAKVSGDQTDPNPANNSATATTTVLGA